MTQSSKGKESKHKDNKGETGKSRARRLYLALCDLRDKKYENFYDKDDQTRDLLVAFAHKLEDRDNEEFPLHFTVKSTGQELTKIANLYDSVDIKQSNTEISAALRELSKRKIVEIIERLTRGVQKKHFYVKRGKLKDNPSDKDWFDEKWDKNGRSNTEEAKDISIQLPKQINDLFIDWIREYQNRHSHFLITSNKLKGAIQWNKFSLVDLGLVECRQENRNIVERVSKYSNFGDTEQYEVVKQYQHETFLEEVLNQGKTAKRLGRSIIVGEPGAGKTTLLQQIHRTILDKQWGIPIWVSLNDLDPISEKDDGEKLLQFIYKRWLKDILNESSLTKLGKKRLEEEQEDLRDLFLDNTERIWLLLDGLDEMTVTGTQSSFSAIQKQIDNLKELSPYRIILTCRENLWNSYSINNIRDFDSFFIQKFTSAQVKQFIENWFNLADKAEFALGLNQKLEDVQNQQLRYLVNNPLLLTMLCVVYEERDDDVRNAFPRNRASLYSRFIDHCRRWKEDEFQIGESDRSTIENKILPEVALWNFENGSSLYNLPENKLKNFLIDKFRWTEIELDTWMKKLENTWLQKIGFTKHDSTQAVYCFFHSTFQEYFAAKGINDWDFFIPRNHIDKPIKGKKYRIFDNKWHEVILFWIGNDIDKNKRKEFIDKLLNLQGSCLDLIHHRALILAAKLIVEFPNYSATQKNIIQSYLSFCYQFNQYLDDDILLINNEVSQKVLVDLLSNNATTWGAKYLIQNQNSNAEFVNQILPLLDLEKYDRDICYSTSEVISAAKNRDCNDKIISLIEEESLNITPYNTEQLLVYLYALQGITNKTQTLQKLLPILKELLSTGDHRMQAAIIDILGQTDDSEINKMIYPYLEKEEGDCRENALYALEKTENWQYIREIIRIIHNNHEYYRNVAIYVIKNILIENKNTRLGKKIIRLVKVLLKNQEPHVRASAIEVLAGMKDERELERIVSKFINDTEVAYSSFDSLLEDAVVTTHSVPVHTAAIIALREINNWQIIETQVIPILKHSNNRYVLRACMLCIGGIKDNRNLTNVLKQEVIPCFKHRDIYVWQYIFDCLKETGNIDLLVPLLDKLDEDMCAFNTKDLEYIGSSLIRHLRYIKEKENAVRVIRYLTSNRFASFACKTSTKMATLYHCIKQLSYAEAYNAINYREILEDAQLQTKILNLSSTDYVCPLLIETPELVKESDTATISQEIINKIYDSYQTELGGYLKETIPDIQNWSKLKTELLNIKRKLPQKVLAFVIRNCDPTPELIYVLEKLTNTVDICWITNKKVNSATITGISSESSDLQSAVNNWLKKLNYKLEQ